MGREAFEGFFAHIAGHVMRRLGTCPWRMTSALVGASSVGQLEENLRVAEGLEFSPEELARIQRGDGELTEVARDGARQGAARNAR